MPGGDGASGALQSRSLGQSWRRGAVALVRFAGAGGGSDRLRGYRDMRLSDYPDTGTAGGGPASQGLGAFGRGGRADRGVRAGEGGRGKSYYC